MSTKTKEVIGFTALVWNGEHWSEAYGYLGSWYKRYQQARWELNWLLKTYPEKYKEWAIERIVLQDDARVRDSRAVVVAQSKDAPIWDLQDERV